MMYPNPVLGVDVSDHQSGISWDALRGAGVRYAWIKTSEGTGWVDPSWRRHRGEARRVGIHRGGYHFARANGPDLAADAISEADTFIDAGGADLDLDLAPALDMEHTSLSRADTIRWARIWCCRVLERRHRHVRVIYWGIWFAVEGGQACMNDPALAEFPWWMPNYGSNSQTSELPSWTPSTNGPRRPDVWQFTSAGRLPGYGANLDLNVTDESTLARLIGEQPPDPEPEQEDDVKDMIWWTLGPDDEGGPSVWAHDVAGFPEGTGPHGFVVRGGLVEHLPTPVEVEAVRGEIALDGGKTDPDRVRQDNWTVRERWGVPDGHFRARTLVGPGGVADHPHNQRAASAPAE